MQQKRDANLTLQRLLELSSLKGLIALFTDLGYNTTLDRIPEKNTATKDTLHSHEDLRSKITHFIPIAQNTDETHTTLYVYLYVLTSVTAKVRDDIVRDLLRRHSGEYLLILATNAAPSMTTLELRELTFVFIDHFMGSGQQLSAFQHTLFSELPSVSTSPSPTREIRSWSIDCRHPDYKAAHFLRGLQYTYRDVIGQCRAISSAYDRAETGEEFFHNRSLFSDHYLKRRLPEDVTEWILTDQEGAESEALTDTSTLLRRLYAGASSTFPGKSLQELQQLLFQPVLDLLGFDWKAAPRTKQQSSMDGQRQPDYRLFQQGTDSPPLAICLTYPWGRTLDDYLDSEEEVSGLSLDPLVNENPAAVAVSLLEQEKVKWAILTNGRLWRLYSARARSRATNYYEVDLQETLTIRRDQTGDALKALRYFWLFFRAKAFEALPRKDYETPPYICFLDYLMRESERYARDLGENLKNRIFDDIFPYFARGFVRSAQSKGDLPHDLLEKSDEIRAQLLQPFFEGTLIFLFRLLCLFYAESRELLPVHDIRYQEKSLEKMKQEIATRAGKNKVHAPHYIEEHYSQDPAETTLYNRLEVLFKAIDKGDPELNVPTYNGGLFLTEVDTSEPAEQLTPDEQAARFLNTYRIPDRYLALGLDLMARDEEERKGKTPKREFY